VNALQMATGAVALIGTLTGFAYKGVTEVRDVRDMSLAEVRALELRTEAKFVPLSEWQDFQWAQLKRELRQIEKDIAEAEFAGNVEFAERLDDERDDLLEFLCRKYPEDRDC
jgi:hypothetical protein